ncbi:MAG TPA: NUDIX hydrolase [Blastocatellia bacterium]|nr:NUDIX hydrolase [Blastocatellia bacterium]
MGRADKENRKNSKGPYCYEYPHPAVTVDVALFRIASERIEVLLIQRARDPFKGRWALPGGFVDQDEALEAAALRELEEETGIKGIRIVQVGAFGDPGRDPRQHTVSVTFTALAETATHTRAGDDAADARWHSAISPPSLAFDHSRILKVSLARMFGKNDPLTSYVMKLPSR